ncbi:MAG: protoporphyrinogen oxidase [Acidobacteria bacterium]|nr:protoporphyrinogen oxidase [Acidobacteriota bacterium]MCL5286602.1 protoporphyrinogen oxidase [Acidobacteriota bacterium]
MRTIVIGGGISGLVCAHRLLQRDHDVLLLEESDRAGGVIGTIRQDHFQFELGPQSFLSNATLLELISGLGLDGELLRADAKAPRYVLLGGALQKVPLGPPDLLGTSLLSVGTKLRLLSEPWRRSRPPEDDESVAAFVRRKFGDDLLQNLVGPLVSGIHAGDPERLSLRSAFPALHQWEAAHGSVLRGAMKSRPPKGTPRPGLCSFREGMQTLVHRLADAIGESLSLSTRVEHIKRGKANGHAGFDVHVTRRGHAETLNADALVLATPTQAAAAIAGELSGAFRELLARIEYAPVAVVGAGYRREQVAHPVEGFGFLVPRKEKLSVLGTVWSSSLFAGRAPVGMVSFTSFVGGATNVEWMNSSDAQIAEVAEREVAQVLRISGPPVTSMMRHWPRALPQFNLGHGRIVAGLEKELRRFPGLFLAGSYLSGPSVGSCAEQAVKTAEAVQTFLSAQESA